MSTVEEREQAQDLYKKTGGPRGVVAILEEITWGLDLDKQLSGVRLMIRLPYSATLASKNINEMVKTADGLALIFNGSPEVWRDILEDRRNGQTEPLARLLQNR